MAAVRSPMDIAKDVAAAWKRQDWAAALVFVDEGEAKWPNASLPSQATWAGLRAAISKRAGLVSAGSGPVVSAEPVAQADPEPVAESVPEVSSEPVVESTPEEVGSAPIPELPDVDLARVRNAVQDHSAQIFASPLVGGSRESVARYLSEGVLSKVTDRHTLQAVWAVVADQVERSPEWLTATAEQRQANIDARASVGRALIDRAHVEFDGGDPDAALASVRAAQLVDPDARYGSGDCASLLETIEQNRDKAGKRGKAVEPAVAPQVSQPEPAPVAADGLTITHSVAEGTNIHGTRKGDGVNSVLRGLRAGWSWYGVKKVWYIKGAKGGGADMPRILAAKRALESAGFRVTLGEISNVDPETGGEVKPKLSNAELLRRARRRSAAMNQINWNLTMSGMPCECGCGETVRLRQSQIVDGPNTGMPMVFLDGHQPGGVREVPASPVVVPAEQGEDGQELRDVERADTVVYPADREFAVRARAAQGELVRQWVGPTVEPVLPVPVGEFRKCVGCGQDDVLHSAEGRPWPHNKLDGVACRSMGRVVEDVEPEPAPVRRKRTGERKPATAGKPKVSAQRKAAPVLPDVFDLAAGARPRQTATEVRRRINAEVAPKLRGLGGEFEAHVYVDKSARTLRVTFVVADEFRQAAELMLAGVVMATPGVAVPVAA